MDFSHVKWFHWIIVHIVGSLFAEDWKQFLAGVRSDLAAKGITEADVDTSEPLWGVVRSE